MNSQPIDFDSNLHMALAWIFVRDHGFQSFLLASGSAHFENQFEAFKLASGYTGKPNVATIHDAWLLLKTAAVKGKCKINGIRFERAPHINVRGVFDWDAGDERDLDPGLPPRRIKADALQNLTPYLAGPEIRLCPLKWATEGGKCWKYIYVDREMLIKAFPVHSRSKNANTGGLTPKEDLVIKANAALYPADQIARNKDERNRFIKEYIMRQHRISVSLRTITRAFEKSDAQKRDQN